MACLQVLKVSFFTFIISAMRGLTESSDDGIAANHSLSVPWMQSWSCGLSQTTLQKMSTKDRQQTKYF